MIIIYIIFVLILLILIISLLELKKDWEEQNAKIDESIAEINKKQKEIDRLKELSDKLNFHLIAKDTALKLKEKQRHKTAARLGGYQKKINDLKEKLEDEEAWRIKLAKENKQLYLDLEKANNLRKEKEQEIVKLKEQVEFLKNNRRAPNLEELKDYTMRRKKVKK